MILAGDLGGTKTVLALYREVSGTVETIREEIFTSQDFPQFEQVLKRFLEGSGQLQIRAMSLGVPGPVIDGRCKTTNLP
ncbi:MAG: glucokinase, partial [Nitrospiria bacterium]